MTLGAADLRGETGRWRIIRQPGPDLARLLIGRPVDEAAALLPRLFNLCRTAQGTAARLSLGLPDTASTSAEIIRDHLAHLYVILPRALGLDPAPPPKPQDRAALFGPAGRMPQDPAALRPWLAGDSALARLARQVDRLFPVALWTLPRLPKAHGMTPGALENSPAGRQADHPVLQDLAYGPLWRFVGRLCDLEAALDDRLPAPHRLADGTALVQAARGTYALRLTHAAGRISGLARLTPTDHQLAPGGALETALGLLPTDRPDLARALVALHDPCIPVTVREVSHA